MRESGGGLEGAFDVRFGGGQIRAESRPNPATAQPRTPPRIPTCGPVHPPGPLSAPLLPSRLCGPPKQAASIPQSKPARTKEGPPQPPRHYSPRHDILPRNARRRRADRDRRHPHHHRIRGDSGAKGHDPRASGPPVLPDDLRPTKCPRQDAHLLRGTSRRRNRPVRSAVSGRQRLQRSARPRAEGRPRRAQPQQSEAQHVRTHRRPLQPRCRAEAVPALSAGQLDRHRPRHAVPDHRRNAVRQANPRPHAALHRLAAARS